MFRALLLVFALLLPMVARAEDAEAVVRDIVAQDAAGRWKSAQHTTLAVVVHDGVRVPLTVGLVLRTGDRVQTEEARVTIGLMDGGELRVGDHADVEVRSRSAIQRLGDVYYHVLSAFTVQFGTVQTAVEGTRFIVLDEPTGVDVRVVEGRVRVTTDKGSARLGRWQTTGESGVARFRPFATSAAVTRSFVASAPRFEVGLAAVGGLDAGGFAGIRLNGRFRIAGPVRLAIESGIGSDGETLRLPRSFGPELVFGALRVGASVMPTVEMARLGCDGQYVALHIGGAGAVGTALPFTRRTALTLQLRAGWVEGPLVEGAVGVAAQW